MRQIRISLLTLLFMMCFAFNIWAQGTWQKHPLPVTVDLYDLCFIDSLQGWTCGDAGTILQTRDGGESWMTQPTGLETYRINALFFSDSLHGHAVAQNYTNPPYGTILLHTRNGGQTWDTARFSQENIFINALWYFDSLHGWMGGSPHALVETLDGGATWHQASIDTSTLAFFPVLNLQFLNEQIGYASGGIFDIAGVIWRTNNGGASWSAIDPSQAPADEVHDLYIFNEQQVMGCGGDPDYGYGVGMIRSSDGGVNWAYEDIGIQGIAFDIDFRTPREVWATLGPQKQFICSMDGSVTWTELPTPDSSAILAITFPDSLHGYAIGEGGSFLKYILPVPPGIADLEQEGSSFQFSVYPNPASRYGGSRLQVVGKVSGNIGVRVFDLSGIEYSGIPSRFLPAGSHILEWHPETELSAGIYLFQLLVDREIMHVERVVFCK